MISLRISELEYEALQKVYRKYGARNVSDFARLAMQRVMSGAHDFDLDLALKVHDIDDRLKSVEQQLTPFLNARKVAP